MRVEGSRPPPWSALASLILPRVEAGGAFPYRVIISRTSPLAKRKQLQAERVLVHFVYFVYLAKNRKCWKPLYLLGLQHFLRLLNSPIAGGQLAHCWGSTRPLLGVNSPIFGGQLAHCWGSTMGEFASWIHCITRDFPALFLFRIALNLFLGLQLVQVERHVF